MKNKAAGKNEDHRRHWCADNADFDEATVALGLGKREVEAKALQMCNTPEERSRYQHYRRSHFNIRYVRRVMCQSTAVDIKAGDKVCVIMAGLAKLFVGNIVERARSIMADRGESGPIQCRHLREACHHEKTVDCHTNYLWLLFGSV